MTEKKERIIWIDIIRIVAIWGVICIHTCGDDYNNAAMGSMMRFKSSTVTTWFGICVPLFLMLSGMLVLGKKQDIKSLWCVKIPRLALLKIFQVCIWLVMSIGLFFYWGETDFMAAITRALSYDGALYFLMILIGCYAVSPIFYEIGKKRELEKYFILLAILFNFIVPILSNIPYVKVPIGYFTNCAQMFLPLGIYIYFITGHYLYYYGPKFSRKTSGGIVAISMIVMLFYRVTYLLFEDSVVWKTFKFLNIGQELGYVNVSTYIFSVAMFIGLRGLLEDIQLPETKWGVESLSIMLGEIR